MKTWAAREIRSVPAFYYDVHYVLLITDCTTYHREIESDIFIALSSGGSACLIQAIGTL
jgi:hypothetical protein